MARHIGKQDIQVLNYIDDFGGVAASKAMATDHFTKLWTTLHHLGMTEAEHKASPPRPSQHMVRLGLQFNTMEMTINFPEARLTEICNIVDAWKKNIWSKTSTNCTLSLEAFPHGPVLLPCQILCESHAGRLQGLPSSGDSHPIRGMSEGSQLVQCLSSQPKRDLHDPSR